MYSTPRNFLVSLLILASYTGYAQELSAVGAIQWKTWICMEELRGVLTYAPEVDLLFVGSSRSMIYVVQGLTGVVVDTINIESWRLHTTGRVLKNVQGLSSNLHGSLLCILAADDYGEGKVAIIEYPSKEIVQDSLYYGRNLGEIKLSPSGRYVVVPDTSQIAAHSRLIDRELSASISLKSHSLLARGDFDRNERYFVYPKLGTVRGLRVLNQVALMSLEDWSLPPKLYEEYGYPELSSDGKYLMNCGYGVPSFDIQLRYVSKASVIELATDSVHWMLQGTPWEDYGGHQTSDLDDFIWSEDATRLFATRNSNDIPSQYRGRVFYEFGDTLPRSRLNRLSYLGGAQQRYSRSVSNPELTVAFTSWNSGLRNGYGVAAEGLVLTTAITSFTDESLPVRVFPNPATDEVHISCEHIRSATSWSLASIHGVIAAHGEMHPDSRSLEGLCKISLPSALTNGVFIVTLIDFQNVPLCSHMVSIVK